MKDLFAGAAVFALWSLLGWSLVVGASSATKVATAASTVPCGACQELGGTDYCECLNHPEVCRADTALYAQVWGDQ